MTARRWQAVVFDLDDTLYSERDYVQSGFRAVADWADSRLAIPAAQAFAELRDLFDRGARGNTFDSWLLSHGLSTSEYVSEMIRVYREHEPDILPFPEVPILLSALRECYKLGLISDGYLSVQERKLNALNLARYFDAIVLSDQFGRSGWKPSTKSFEKALCQLGSSATRAVYVADNPVKDFLGARRVGMTTIWCRRPGGLYSLEEPPTPAHAPHHVISALDQLEAALSQLEQSA